MSSCTCVFKPVTGKVYKMMVNSKANKSTQGGAQRWTWGCPATPPWEESGVLNATTTAGGLLQNPTPLSVSVLLCITQKTDREKSVAHSAWARIWSLHAHEHATVPQPGRDLCQWQQWAHGWRKLLSRLCWGWTLKPVCVQNNWKKGKKIWGNKTVTEQM